MNLERVREGSTDLLVPPGFSRKGPGKNTGDVFYNRQMEFGRDVSVILSGVILEAGDSALDGLAATGARGIRMAKEGNSGAGFHLNDRNEKARMIMEKNLDLNGLSSEVTVSTQDLRALLACDHFDYIDVDPFGTPVEFIDSAVQSVSNGGTVAVTATDTAPLCGTYPRTSARRYGARSMRSGFSHETGLRILIGYIVREAAKYDRGCEPLLCFSADHYFRCHLRVTKGASRADASLGKMGYAIHDLRSLEREVSPHPPAENEAFAGPMWVGNLHNGETLGKMAVREGLGTSKRLGKMLVIWRKEASAPALYYVVDEFASRTKCQPPKMDVLLERLRDFDPEASPTHFDPKGFKTRLSPEEIMAVFRETSARSSATPG